MLGGNGKLFLLLSVLLCTCKARQERAATSAAPLESLGDFATLVEGRLPLICGFLRQSEEPACKHALIEAVCAQGKRSLKEAIDLLISDEAIKGLTADEISRKSLGDSLYKEFLLALSGGSNSDAAQGFESAANRCINGEKIEQAEAFEVEAATPEFHSRAASARRAFWIAALGGLAFEMARGPLLNAAAQVISQQVAARISPGTALSMRALLGLGLCAVGADTIAAFMASPDLDRRGNACTDAFSVYPGRAKSCVQTVGSVCGSLAGMVDIRHFGIHSEEEITQFLISTANLGISGLCYAGGRVSTVACGFISSSANQIAKAWRTGTNDWAECLGVAKAAECLGERWTAGGWTNNHGVSTPRREQGRDGVEYWARSCCWCYKVLGEAPSHSPTSRLRLSSVANHLEPIQQGDVATGSCAAKEGKRYPMQVDGAGRGRYFFYEYEKCDRVDVLGTLCAVETADPESPMKKIPNPLRVWNDAEKQVGDRVILPDEDFSIYQTSGGKYRR